MGFRFFRRMKIAPGITINMSKSGPSVSFGPRGAKYTVSRKGTRKTFGLTGTGLFYTKFNSNKSKKKQRKKIIEENQGKLLNIGFFKSLFVPKEEKEFIEGCKSLVAGDNKKAYTIFKDVNGIADSYFLSGFLAFHFTKYDEALDFFNKAVELKNDLSKKINEYNMSVALSIPVTENIDVYIRPDITGILLALVEIYQIKKEFDKALKAAEKLLSISPDDLLIKLSYVELLTDINETKKDMKINDKIVKEIQNIGNKEDIECALLLYKAKALINLNMYTAARDVLTFALRKKKGRSEELLNELMHQRAMVYNHLGKKSQAKKDLERIYMNEPDFDFDEDVKNLMNI